MACFATNVNSTSRALANAPVAKLVRRGGMLTVVALLLAAGTAAQGQTALTWNNGAGSSAYSAPLNWTGGAVGAVPINNGGNLFSAIIGDARTVTLDALTPTLIQVQDFTIGNSTFNVGLGRTYRVLDDASINGLIAASDLGLFSTQGNPSALGVLARFAATAGGVINLNAVTWNSGGANSGRITDSLFSASGVGSQINAASLTSLVYGSTQFGNYTNDISATNSGSINLSGLQTLQNLTGNNDLLNINVNTGGSLNLSGLQSINQNAIGNGAVFFNIGTGATLNLTGLINADRVRFNLTGTGSLNAPNLATLTRSELNVNAGLNLTLGTLTNIDNTRVLVSDGRTFSSGATTAVSHFGYWGGDYTLYSATGAGSILNLSSVQTLSIGTNSGRNTVTIAARDGGVINLSGLTSLGVISGQDEILNFEVTGAGSNINFSNLQTITGIGNTNDVTQFTIGAGRTLSLPALTSATRVSLNIAAGGAFSAPVATSFTNSTLVFDGTTSITFGAVINFDNTRLIASNGAVVSGFSDTELVSAYWHGGNFDLLSATGPGTQLNLPGLQRIRYATNSGPNTITIAARNGASVNLAGLTSVQNWADDDDTLNFELSGLGSTLNLNALATITNVSSHTNTGTRFTLNDGRSLTLPALTSAQKLFATLSAGSTLSVPLLQTASQLALTLGAGSTFSAPALRTLTTSTLSISPGSTTAISNLTNIDSSRFFVTGGATFNAVTATSYATSYVYNGATFPLFSADGAGSSLNLSSLATFTYASSSGNFRLTASNGGALNLSGLTTTSIVAGEDDFLYFDVLGAGSTLNLNSLTTIGQGGNGNNRTVFTADAGNTLNVPALATASKVIFAMSNGATFNAPNLVTLTETLLTPSPTWGVTTGLLSQIDRTAIRVSGGLNYNRVTDTNWNYQTAQNYFGNSFDLFTATGAGSILNLSSLQTINYTTNYGPVTMTVAARDGGVVNLSGLQSIVINNGDDDVLRFNVDSGTINLNSLATINLPGTGNAFVDFIVGTNQTQALPALATANNTRFSLGAGASVTAPLLTTLSTGSAISLASGATISLPQLATFNTSSITLAAGRILSLPGLTSVDRFTYSLGAGAAIQAPALAAITNTLLSISGPGLTTGTITDFSNSRVLLSGGQSFTLSDPSYTNIYIWNSANIDILTATGAGTVLNAAAVTSLTYAISGQNIYTIAARDGGTVNLSALTSIVGTAGEDDTLNLELTGSGSTLNLSSLTTISAIGNTNDRVRFTAGAGNTLTAPALTTASRIQFNVSAGGTVSLPALTALTQSSLAISNIGTINLNAATLTNMDQTIIDVTNGASFVNAGMISANNAYFWGSNFSMYRADGTGSTLTLSGLRSLVFGTNTGRNTISVTASNGGVINLPSLRDISIVSVNEDDELAFSAVNPGSVIRFGPITNVNATNNNNRTPAVSFTVSQGGRMEFGDLTITNQSAATIADDQSTFAITRSLIVRGGTINVAPGATINIGKHVYNYGTVEANWVMQSAILNFAAAGVHFFEAAGLNLGPINPANNGNFGVGRIQLGSVSTAAQLQMTDLANNGNRGGNLPEALYIFGVGQATALESLQLLSGSTLFLDNIDVYVRENGNWIWLNSLFGPTQTVVAWGGGFLHLPTPSAFGLLCLAGLVAARRRRA